MRQRDHELLSDPTMRRPLLFYSVTLPANYVCLARLLRLRLERYVLRAYVRLRLREKGKYDQSKRGLRHFPPLAAPTLCGTRNG